MKKGEWAFMKAIVNGRILLPDSEIERLLDDAYQYLPDGRYGESAKAVIRGAEASYDDAVGKGWTYDSASGVW